jgi:hypothetical protein
VILAELQGGMRTFVLATASIVIFATAPAAAQDCGAIRCRSAILQSVQA